MTFDRNKDLQNESHMISEDKNYMGEIVTKDRSLNQNAENHKVEEDGYYCETPNSNISKFNTECELENKYRKNQIFNNIPNLLKISHRQTQVLQLVSFLDLYNIPQSMPLVHFLNGPKSSGVNYVARSLLKHYSDCGYEYIVVKKVSVIDHKSLMRDIGRRLYNLLSKKYPENDESDFGDLENVNFEENLNYSKIKNIKSGLDARSIETFSSFKDYLQNLLLYYDIHIDASTSIYIFLQEFDEYPLLDYNTVFRFYKIIESLHGSKFQIKLIFSFHESALMKQYTGGMVNPVITQFPRYTAFEVESILVSYLCRDLIEMNKSFGKKFISVCCESFIQYVGYDVVQLAKIIKYKYKQYEQEIILNNYDFVKFLQKNKELLLTVEISAPKKRRHNELESESAALEKLVSVDKYSNFSRMSKYILISCFYCSYYPVKCDSLFFMKSINNNLLAKSKVSRGNQNKFEIHTEPRGFGLERLLLVFNIFFFQDDLDQESPRNLNGTDINFAKCFTQLLDSKYVGKNINDYFDCYRTDCKYKLLLPPSEIKKISESVGFERVELIV